VRVGSTDHKGAVAEAKIAAAALELGVSVFKPIAEHGRCDLVFEVGPQLLRVQCKCANRKGGVLDIRLGGCYLSAHGYVRSTYAAHEIDAVAAYSPELDQCYLLPIELVARLRCIYLRLEPTKNSQRAGLHWASDFRLRGAIAQLGERSAGSRKGGGSSPPGSTNDGVATIGADDFRRFFGWYAQRASRGESFLITRRGKPFVRLLPPTDQARLAPADPAAT
jgi:prevent-host-death family protein